VLDLVEEVLEAGGALAAADDFPVAFGVVGIGHAVSRYTDQAGNASPVNALGLVATVRF